MSNLYQFQEKELSEDTITAGALRQILEHVPNDAMVLVSAQSEIQPINITMVQHDPSLDFGAVVLIEGD